MPNIYLDDISAAAESYKPIQAATALWVLTAEPKYIPTILSAANTIKQRFFGSKVMSCSIINAKSGACSENCAFCAQSAQHKTNIDTYDLKHNAEILAAFNEVKKLPITKFGIVTSGGVPSSQEVEQLSELMHNNKDQKIGWCASLGAISKEDLLKLKAAGLTRFHHNLETAENYFPNVCTSHTYADRVRTIKLVQECGVEICAGGILGMGESNQDRVAMAQALNNLQVTSMPLNFLIPIKNTKLEYLTPLKPLEIIRIIAMFRLTNPAAEIKVCAGRMHLRELQPMIFYAGATGIMIGSLLTVAGRNPEFDLQMLKDLELNYA